MSKPILTVCLLLCAVLLTQCKKEPETPTVVIESRASISTLISTFLDGGGNYKEIRFAEVIEASTGQLVIPLDPNEEVDTIILDEISSALDETLKTLNEGESVRLETQISEAVDAAPGVSCARPRNKEGVLVRSAYPDLRMLHEESGRVIYLVPKLVERGSLESSLRTFYYTPKGETGTVLEDAHHLVVGIEHDGSTKDRKYLDWHIVDLANFMVRIKAEFQADNKDLYKPELIIRQSSKTD